MLNRRILRIKAFKVLYGYAEDPSMTLKEAEAQLEISCRATRDLYLFMLALIPSLTREAAQRIEAARAKFNPTSEERNPNMKFAQNAIARILDEDPDFQKVIAKSKLSWDQYDAFLRHLYDRVKASSYFAEYMAAPGTSVKEDAALFTSIYENELVDDAELSDILEDLSIYWNDDLAYSLTYCCRTLDDFARGRRWSLPPLYQSELKGDASLDSDKAFVTTLLRNAYSGWNEYCELVAASVPKWDKERLVLVDLVLVVLGLSEARRCPEIPVKVTINEYVDITKYYSTPKSRSFVNGLLDTVIQSMVADGRIVKTGKGLL